MSQKFTKVEGPDSESGFACNDHISREEAIAEARHHFRAQMDEAKTFLAFTDDELYVYQCTGLYREKNIRELTTSTT